MSTLQLNLFGSFGAFLDGHPIENTSIKSQALLIYLAVERDRPHRRDSLFTLLWPGMPEKSARHNLNQAVYALRQNIPDIEDGQGNRSSLILGDRLSIQLNPDWDLEVDIHKFDDLLESVQTHVHPDLASCGSCHTALEGALTLYQGDFLADFYLEDSNEFEEWAEAVREDYRSKLTGTLATLTDIAIQAGDHDQALAYIDRQLSIDELFERANRLKIEVLALAGRRVEAMRHYREFTRSLDDQLATNPSQETTALYDRIQSEDLTASPARTQPATPELVTPRTNLPSQPTPFIGREQELAQLEEMLDDPDKRLITIVGSGGMGKTRLALEAAERALKTAQFPNGVFFVDLTSLSDIERMVLYLAETLNLHILASVRKKRSPKQQLLDYLRDRRMLLVLDNFDHLCSPPKLSEAEIETDATTLVAEMLSAAPGTCILVTSRERLNLQAEQIYLIQGLAYPDNGYLENTAVYSAINLFIQTAKRVQPNFAVGESDWINLTEICQLVEGMPLGLELAAAWVDMLSLADIAAEIQQSVDFLETEMRDVPDRHRSIRATFDSSWRNFTKGEQSIFIQLSVFRGGFTRQAAQAVTGATLRQLYRLANKSFIQFNQGRDRYQVHELLRQYGTELLKRDPELESSLRDRHSSYYCQMLASYTDDLKGVRQLQILEAIELDINNIQMAWNQAITRREIEEISISYEPLFRYYSEHGRHMQGIKEFEGALAMLRTNQTAEKKGYIIGQILYFLAVLYFFPDQHEKIFEYLKESIDIFQRIGAREETLKPLLILARLQTSIEESNQLLHECLTLAREGDYQWAIGRSLQLLGENDRDSGNYEQAKRRLQEALKQLRKTDDWSNTFVAIAWLSFIAVDLGHYDEALTLARECASFERKFAPKFPMFGTRVLGRVLYALREFDKAEDQFQQSLALSREYNLGSWTPLCLYHLGEISFGTGNYASANQRYKQSLTEALEFNNLELVARNQNALGRLALVQGDFLQAKDYLLEALQTANSLYRPPILLSIFATSAELFVKENNLEQAALLATFVTNHKASTAMIRERANQLLAYLVAQLSIRKLEEVRRRSQQSDLENLAERLTIDLETKCRGKLS